MMRLIAIEVRDGMSFRTYEHDRHGIVETFSIRSVTYILPAP